ncbi:MAG: sel1 repeat family protein [Alphaproteobacteria bacterium]|nr:sel1 repeat family protein [Alphaproteobacteria bacterium]
MRPSPRGRAWEDRDRQGSRGPSLARLSEPVRDSRMPAMSDTILEPGASVAAGIDAHDRGDFERARRLLLGTAEAGDGTAQFYLGVICHFGPEPFNNTDLAALWYRRAAEQGLLGAQRNLGVLYEEGVSKRQSDANAAKWYRRAAEQGDALAQHNLAMMLSEGRGVPEDDEEATMWLRRAATQDDRPSQIALALRLSLGIGETEDLIQAYAWLTLALKSSDKVDDKDRVTWLRKHVARRLSIQQIGAAEQLARRLTA